MLLYGECIAQHAICPYINFELFYIKKKTRYTNEDKNKKTVEQFWYTL